MALDALRCNHLAPLGFKGLSEGFLKRTDISLDLLSQKRHLTVMTSRTISLFRASPTHYRLLDTL